VAVSDQVAHSVPDALTVVGHNRTVSESDLPIVVRDGHQRQPQAGEVG
jgi:hypothetical protein